MAEESRRERLRASPYVSGLVEDLASRQRELREARTDEHVRELAQLTIEWVLEDVRPTLSKIDSGLAEDIQACWVDTIASGMTAPAQPDEGRVHVVTRLRKTEALVRKALG